MTLTPMLPVVDNHLPEQPVKFLEGRTSTWTSGRSC